MFAVVNRATAAVHANAWDGPKNATATRVPSETRRMQAAFAAHRRHVGRVPPRGQHPRVAILTAAAPGPWGQPIDAASADRPHREFTRLPAYRPRLDPVERFRKTLRRRATCNRRLDTPADLRRLSGPA